VKTNKNDAADAEAICCEAVARPNMRFVPIKNVEQQAVLALHRARQWQTGGVHVSALPTYSTTGRLTAAPSGARDQSGSMAPMCQLIPKIT
jgi:hypothetical protein